MAKELPTVSELERAEQCETCKWWTWDGETKKYASCKVGLCRRYPPVYNPYSNGPKNHCWVDECIFPETYVDDFCGEWQAK